MDDKAKSCFNCKHSYPPHCSMAKQMVGPLGDSVYFITSPASVTVELTEKIVSIVAQACKRYEREE